MTYDNTNNIVIFKNNKKMTEKQPDYTGTVNVEGKEYTISLWVKEGKAGKFFGGNIKEPYKKLENFSDKVNKKEEDKDGLPF